MKTGICELQERGDRDYDLFGTPLVESVRLGRPAKAVMSLREARDYAKLALKCARLRRTHDRLQTAQTFAQWRDAVDDAPAGTVDDLYAMVRGGK